MKRSVSRRALQALIVSGASSWLCACVGTETGNPVAQQSLALETRSSSPDVSTDTRADASLHVSSAWISLGDLRFVESSDCEHGAGTRVDIDGPIAVELVEEHKQLDLHLTAAKYCRVRLRMDKAKDIAGAPSELEDHSIVVNGTRADGVSFSLRSKRNYALDLRARDDAFEVADAASDMILAFDLSAWLAGVDLAAALPNAAGVIAIDDGSERERLDVFEDNVKRAMELFRDRDGDAKLDDDELRHVLAGGE